MKLKHVVAAVALALSSQLASASVLTFDDLSGQATMPASYGGFTWSGWTHYDWAQPPYNPASGAVRLYDLSNANSISSATDFVFDGAYFAGYDFAPVTFNLYNNSILVHTSGSLAPSATPTFLSSGYSGLVDMVQIDSPSPDYFVMDDFTYNSTTPIPEPETYAMLLAGLGLLGFAARRRKQKEAAAA